VCFDGFVGPWRGVEDSSELLVAPAQIIEYARDSSLIEGRSSLFLDEIAKLEPAMAIIERLQT
jgi:hypothetical protein